MTALPRSTQALILLLDRALPGPFLDVGSHLGTVAGRSGCTYVHNDLTACEGARASGVPSVHHTDVLPEGPYGAIFFDAREYDPGLAAETVAQAAGRLTPGGVLVTTARKADVDSRFAEVTEDSEALLARSPQPVEREAEWPAYAAVFGGHAYQVQSAPGVFSPRGLDEGSRVMLSQIKATAGARFLDLGCGAGVVSRIASEAWGCQVTAVDVSARALRLTTWNAPMARVVASDGFRQLAGEQFDIIASNPPYHTDFAVARAFIEGAYQHLAPGGTLYLVVKRSDWYLRKVRDVFGGCRSTEEAGYTVIMAERRAPRPDRGAATPTPATTRKHARRMASVKHKGRR